MTFSPDMETLRAYRQKLEAERAPLVKALAEIDKQISEIELAARVLDRAASVVMTIPLADYRIVGDVTSSGEDKQARKPANLPTVPEMIKTILAEFQEIGDDAGMTPKEITIHISRRWWPEVTTTEVSPIAWRMYKRQELIKNGARYRLPNPGEVIPVPPSNEDDIETIMAVRD